MAEPLRVFQGSTLSRTLTLRDAVGDPVTDTYDGTEEFTLTVWAGDDRAAATMAASSATWLDAAAGTATLRLDQADTAALAAGRYRVLVQLADGLDLIDVFDAVLAVEAAAAAGTAGSTYATLADLRLYCDWIESVKGEGDQAGFAEQLAEARAWLEEIIHAHDPRHGGGLAYRMQAGWMGPLQSGLKSRWLVDALAADQLIVTRAVRKACAYYALGLILGSKIGTKDKVSLATLGAQFTARATAAASTLVVEIDTDADGYGEVSIDLSRAAVPRA